MAEAFGARKLSRALNIHDLRGLAKRRLPDVVFDYLDGGAETRLHFARIAGYLAM